MHTGREEIATIPIKSLIDKYVHNQPEEINDWSGLPADGFLTPVDAKNFLEGVLDFNVTSLGAVLFSNAWNAAHELKDNNK